MTYIVESTLDSASFNTQEYALAYYLDKVREINTLCCIYPDCYALPDDADYEVALYTDCIINTDDYITGMTID
jgi:hypothetical protein